MFHFKCITFVGNIHRSLPGMQPVLLEMSGRARAGTGPRAVGLHDSGHYAGRNETESAMQQNVLGQPAVTK
jgi:hypothetical protein